MRPISRPRLDEKSVAPKQLVDALAVVWDAINAGAVPIDRAVRTTDASPTTIWTQEVGKNRVWSVDLEVLGYATDGNAATYRRLVRVKRIGSAAPVLLGTDTIGTDREDIAAWDLAILVGTTNLTVTVTGDARTVDWRLMGQLRERS